jgi:hypothetical protein
MQMLPAADSRRPDRHEDDAVEARPGGYVVLLELPGGHLVVTEPQNDAAAALGKALSLVPSCTPIATRAVIPVIANATGLMTALAEATHA